MKINTKALLLTTFVSLTLGSNLQATEVLTSSFNNWKGTVSSFAEWDFIIPSSGYNTASGYTLNVGTFGPLTVTGPDNAGYTLNKVTGYSSLNLTGIQSANDGIGTMVFTTPVSGLTAFALGVGITGTTAPITVTLSDGEVFTQTVTAGTNGFIGISSAVPITSFTLSTSSGSQIDLTDFFAGPSNEPAEAPTAEVTTALMIGSGLFLFGARRKVYSNFSRLRAQTN